MGEQERFVTVLDLVGPKYEPAIIEGETIIERKSAWRHYDDAVNDALDWAAELGLSYKKP